MVFWLFGTFWQGVAKTCDLPHSFSGALMSFTCRHDFFEALLESTTSPLKKGDSHCLMTPARMCHLEKMTVNKLEGIGVFFGREEREGLR